MAKKSVQIVFSDREYIYEHGHAPKGRGCWMFEIEGIEYTAGCCKTLTEAKKEVSEYIRSVVPDGYTGCYGDGWITVNILP